MSDTRASHSIRGLVALFLRLGITAFGGPAAHIALMKQEVVERRKWLSQSEYLDIVGAVGLIPGPSSTEVAMHIGFRRAGWIGLLLAGICFITPAALMVTALAWAYVRFGHLPQIQGILYGVKPVVIVVIFQAIIGLGRSALKSRFLAGIGITALAASFLGVNPLLLMLAAGFLASAPGFRLEKQKKSFLPLAALLLAISFFAAAPMIFSKYYVAANRLNLTSLFLVFLKLGSVVYGSGYVLLVFLRSELVSARGWISSTQLLDSIAVGQVTPGPVFTTAAFIGYILMGPKGAFLAAVGMFLPAFLFVALSGRLVPLLRKSPATGRFLDGVNVAALALMAAVTWQLGHSAVRDAVTLILAIGSAFLLLRYRYNSGWLLLAAAGIGMIIQVVRK